MSPKATPYLDTALGLWNELDSLWDDEAKVYAPQAGTTNSTYTLWDAGLIVGAFGEILGLPGIDPFVRDLAQQRYLDCHENFVLGSASPTRRCPRQVGQTFSSRRFNTTRRSGSGP